MGGDHKCPVCQATFTRPQHVARHMRSHTGDRPYKCQYCGDQFARSDLLARHINKCHANEKPLANVVPGGRRKGSAAASRATTSKQACDQCVQSSLPCDGSNPCSKCLSRKSRCTYVKFHRQTAPSGPGHHPPRSPSSSSSSLSSSIPPARHLDGFILPPPSSAPSIISPPFSGPDQIFNTHFTFNPAAPAYPPNWSATEMSQLAFSVTSDADMTAKYRTQPDSLRRVSTSFLPNSSPTILSSGFTIQPPPGHWYPAWGESGTYPSLDDTKSFDGVARTHSLASSEPASFTPDIYGPGLVGSAYRPRKVSLDFSDSSSATSHSLPSSATSSNVHLPLPANELYDGAEQMQRHTHGAHILQHHRRSSMPTSLPPPFSAPSDPSQPPSTQQPQRVGEGSFSSAFGLMSIDDPSALAGLSDGVPFFSDLGIGVLPNSPNATPMPTRMHHSHVHQRERGMSLGALPTPGSTKETVDSREMKEMWRTFLRSPLGGSGSGTIDVPTIGQMPQSPPGQRRRVRVSSLPSVTPTVEKGHPLMVNGHGEGTTTARPTALGHPDDLKSYEAAVNARSTSLKLNLVPRRKGTRASVCDSPQAEEGMGSSHASSALGAGASAGERGDQQGLSRPSSSSSTSSFAQAYTMPCIHHPSLNVHHTHGVVKPPPMQGASISLPLPPSMSMSGIHPPHSHSHSHSHSHGHGHSHSMTFGSSTSLPLEPGSRASSVTSDGTGTGGSGSDGEVFRPSFKRYASQTLGPPSSKRALVERGGEKGVDGRGQSGEAMGEDKNKGDRDGENMMEGVEVGVSGSPGPRSRPIAALPERAKRV